jgi:hypothetical protein
VADIQLSYILPDGSRHEYIRAEKSAFRFDPGGVVHVNSTIGDARRPDYELSEGQLGTQQLMWCIEQIGDDGKTVALREQRMKLSAYSGASFTLTPA